VSEPRGDRGRPSRERFEGKPRTEDPNKGKFRGDRDKGGRDKGGRDKGGRDRDKGGRESGPSHRQYATSASPRERDRPVDPNSPFAKLAALREQLTANRKD
jgi:ATP-dependent RNA helicase SUPV3L1/SUV3